MMLNTLINRTILGGDKCNKTSQEMDRECLGGWGRGAASGRGIGAQIRMKDE